MAIVAQSLVKFRLFPLELNIAFEKTKLFPYLLALFISTGGRKQDLLFFLALLTRVGFQKAISSIEVGNFIVNQLVKDGKRSSKETSKACIVDHVKQTNFT